MFKFTEKEFWLGTYFSAENGLGIDSFITLNARGRHLLLVTNEKQIGVLRRFQGDIKRKLNLKFNHNKRNKTILKMFMVSDE